jgi:hypothetical protein
MSTLSTSAAVREGAIPGTRIINGMRVPFYRGGEGRCRGEGGKERRKEGRKERRKEERKAAGNGLQLIGVP